MNARIPPNEWEALSAYLDNQLNPKERRRIELRLKEEPELRQTLDELDKTIQLLRSTPRLRAPRNFTLTTEMVGIHKRNRSAPAFYSGLRLASILATLFFVLITAGSLILHNSLTSQTVVLQSAPQNESSVPFGKGGGGGGGAVEAPAPAMAPTQEALTAQMEEITATPEALTVQLTPMTNTGVAATQPPVQALAMPRESAVTDEAATGKEPSQEVVPPSSEVSSPQRRTWSIVAAIQIVLASLALITGIAALYFRRRISR